MFKTAFSYTKQNFNKWPIIETSDMHSYELADAYKDKVPYVWFVDTEYDIVDGFDWNFRPEDNNRFCIHSFPRCFHKSKRPVNWDVVKLVPTNPLARITQTVNQQLISSFSYSEYPTYVYSFDKFSLKKVPKGSMNKHRIIRTRKSLDEIFLNLNLDYIEDYVWLVDIDVEVDSKFYFEFRPVLENTIYMFKLNHKSTNLVYGDLGLILVPKSYIAALQNKKPTVVTYKEVDVVAGVLNDMTDPMKAWERAFATASLLIQNKFPNNDKKLKNKIMSEYITNNTSRMHDYIKDACNYAVMENEKSYIDVNDLHNHRWLDQAFEERQEFLRNRQSNQHPNRLDIIKRIYGESSEQYKAYEQKLKTV